jgi:hypothetical protein
MSKLGSVAGISADQWTLVIEATTNVFVSLRPYAVPSDCISFAQAEIRAFSWCG